MKSSILLLLAVLSAGRVTEATESDRRVVTVHGPGDINELIELGIDFASESPRFPADAIVTREQTEAIGRLGFRAEPVTPPPCLDIPGEYHTYQETFRFFDSLQSLHPDIVSLRCIGTTRWRSVPIYAVKISDNVATEEDEPAVLYTGVTHAREPLGNEIIIHLARYLCAGYATSPRVQRWVDSIEIWLIPVVNPDGFMYMFESARSNPWWRKNQRDNNENGRFDYSYDGVDLNRNFDWCWSRGGDTTPGSWVYRGPAPGSEDETQAWCRLAREQQPVFGISYHSYSEIVLYPWSVGGRFTPDDDVYTATANRMAYLIGYTAGRNGGTNMSDDWLYARVGQLDFIVETGTQFIEPGHRILGICHQNFHADTFLFNRLFYSGVTGHVIDSVSGTPVGAEVQVLGRIDTTLDPRTTDSLFGRFHRVLRPSTYVFRFIAPGYDTVTVTGVRVHADSLTRLEVRMRRSAGIAELVPLKPDRVMALPNPFSGRCVLSTIPPERIVIHDVQGRLVRSFAPADFSVWYGKDDCDRRLAPGVYFLSCESGCVPTRVVLQR